MENLTWILQGSKNSVIKVYMTVNNNIALESRHIIETNSDFFGGVFYDNLDFIDCHLFEGCAKTGDFLVIAAVDGGYLVLAEDLENYEAIVYCEKFTVIEYLEG